MMKSLITSSLLFASLLTVSPRLATAKDEPAKDVTRVPVVSFEAHDTDPRDWGRPVILVAAALGVTPEVFREAFSQVRPAPAGTKPSRQQERANKAVLLKALGKYGVTNDRLDTVSDYYRYVRSRGELWTHRPAVAVALVRDGAVVGYEVKDAGADYSSPPKVTVPIVKSAPPEIQLSFGKTLETNGSITSITVPSPT
jgi:hypothetical protein